MRQKVMKLFYAVFALCFGWLFMHIVFFGSRYDYEGWPLMLWILCVLAMFFLLDYFIKKYENILEKCHLYLVAIFLVFMGAAQLNFGMQLRFTPAWDLQAIYDGAIEWVKTGTFASFYEYFYWFPNNLGGLNFFHGVFCVADMLGIEDFFSVAMVVNGIMSLGTIYMTSAVCRKLYGVRGELLVLGVYAVSLPIYFIAPVFYTDSLSMLFPISVYYFYLCLKEEKGFAKRLIFGVLMGLFAVVGMQIKFTVAIVLIAILIDALFTYELKKTGVMAAIVLCVVLIGYGCFNATFYEEHLDKETAEIMNTPNLHWVMMGLAGDGGYNPGDYEFTRSFRDTEVRDEALKEEISRRIEAYGFPGMVELLTSKGETCFGCGTYGLDEFLDDTPEEENFLHSFLLTNGENYRVYEHICAGVLFAVYVLMIVSAFVDVVAGDGKSWRNIVPRMATYGLLLLLIFWEARGRYIVNYIPLYFVAAVGGIEQAKVLVKSVGRFKKGK